MAYLRKSVLFVLILWVVTPMVADPIDCTLLNGQRSDQLLSILHTQISNHKQLSYTEAWTYNSKIDLDVRGQIVDMYSDCVLYSSNNCGGVTDEECLCYNREHLLPKSWWGGGPDEPMYTDAVHVVPVESYANTQRFDYPYGEPTNTSVKWSNTVGAKLGKNSAYGTSGYVFYPNPEYRGDIARIYFYMITCYKNKNLTCNSEARRVIAYNGQSSFKSAFLNLLLKWHREDPVSSWEQTRNNRIERVQGNRNPFVDYSELVEYIWGTKKGQSYVCTTDVERVPAMVPAAGKVMRNGHIYIESNKRIYTILGQTIIK